MKHDMVCCFFPHSWVQLGRTQNIPCLKRPKFEVQLCSVALCLPQLRSRFQEASIEVWPFRWATFQCSKLCLFCKENCMIFNRGIVDGESDTSFTLEVCVRVLPRCFWKLSERLQTVSLQADFFAICLRSFETFSTTWWWICVGAVRALIHWWWKNTWEFRMAKWCCMGWEEFRMDKMLRNKDHKEQRLSISQRIDSGNWRYFSQPRYTNLCSSFF